MKSQKIFSILFLLNLVACGSQPLQKVEETSIVDQSAASLTECLGRGPSSATLTCEDLLKRLPVEALRDQRALKAKNSSASSESTSLQNFRDQRLQALNITLDRALEILSPVPGQTPPETLHVFLKQVNPKWTLTLIKERLAVKNSFWQRSKAFIGILRNPEEYTRCDQATDHLNKLTNPQEKLFLAEFIVRRRPLLLVGSEKNLLERSRIVDQLWYSTDGNWVVNRVKQNIGAKNRRQLADEYRRLWDQLQGKTSKETDASAFLARMLSEREIQKHIEDAFDQEADLPQTYDFVLTAIARKSVTEQFVAEALDRKLFALTNDGQIELALSLLRKYSYIRKEGYEKDTAKLVEPYRKLLSKVSAKEGRQLLLGEWVLLGPKAVQAYVGQDEHSIDRIQNLVALNGANPAVKNGVGEYLATLDPKSELGKVVYANPKLRQRIYLKSPELEKKHLDNELDVLQASNVNNSPGFYDGVLQNQDRIDGALQRALQSVIQANAPPAMFSKHPRPWAAFLKSIPAADRKEVVLALLQKNSNTTSEISNFISNIDPIDGVADSVTGFLRNHKFMQPSRTEFSSDQIVRMFGGVRFGQFFPAFKGVTISDGATRTKFKVAVMTNAIVGGPSLDRRWIREKISDSDTRASLKETYGFQPVLGFGDLAEHLNVNFGNNNRSRQIRGLIVQGHYEKTGLSLMTRLNSERGQDQVEDSAPTVNRRLSRSLQTGALSTEPALIRRLFVKYWNLNANQSLIDSFRQRALVIAHEDGAFYPLRVEIHNFPSPKTLAQVIEYRDTVLNKEKILHEVDAIIGELKQFLSMSGGQNGLAEVVNRDLPLNDESRKVLLDAMAGRRLRDPLDFLEMTMALRDLYQDIKSKSQDVVETEKYSGDQALSDAGVALLTQWVEGMSSLSLPKRVKGFNAAIDTLRHDDFLLAQEADVWKGTLQGIVADKNLTALEKKEVVNQVLKGIIDQVYFRVSDDFGHYDNSVYQTVRSPENPAPLKFIDDIMRSGSVFALSKAVDQQASEIARALKIQHEVGGRPTDALVNIYNPGEAVGILRLNKNPMEMGRDDIAVFDQMPGECAAVAGFITVGVGARLSHLQLLAKSLKIPNIQVARELMHNLKDYDGKWVRITAEPNGRLVIEEASAENKIAKSKNQRVQIPVANHAIAKPISFSELHDPSSGHYAGPKGVTLAKLYQGGLKELTPDGFVLPFGFFNRYLEETGLKPLLDLLGQVNLKNRHLIGVLTAQIANKIESNPIPDSLLKEVETAVNDLEKRTGNKLGYFFRSDTNVEDLPNFNGAGLNESVPNVRNNLAEMDKAIRQVWISPFSEKSIYWRGAALGRPNVTVAEPSVVVMPTINVKASGVLLTRGGSKWLPGRGSLSANFGIGSVVEAGRPVEEFSFESGVARRISASVSQTGPVADDKGGLMQVQIQRGTNVLSLQQASNLNSMGQKIESVLGPEPHGWDVEWGIDANDNLIILQARPNM